MGGWNLRMAWAQACYTPLHSEPASPLSLRTVYHKCTTLRQSFDHLYFFQSIIAQHTSQNWKAVMSSVKMSEYCHMIVLTNELRKKLRWSHQKKPYWNVPLCSELHIWLTAFSVLAQFSELCFYLLNICKFSPRFECLLKIWSTSCLVLPCLNQLVH